MKNWDKEELVKYIQHLEELVKKSKNTHKWYHSKAVKSMNKQVLEILTRDLVNAKLELDNRKDI